MAPKYALSDSESEPEADSTNLPSDATLEKALRDEVLSRVKAGKHEELTVKRVRLAVEQELKLEEGFFRSTGDWKTRSQDIIKDEVVRLLHSLHLVVSGRPSTNLRLSPQERQDDHDEDIPEPAKEAKSPSPPSKPAPKRSKPETAPKSRKRQKTETPASEEEEEAELSEEDSEEVDPEEKEEEDKPKKRSAELVKKAKPKSTKPTSPELSEEPEDKPEATKTSEEVVKDDSDSEMSVVIDEEPKPAPKRQKTTAGPKEKKKAAPKAKAKDEDVDPDQAEIKRLQGWLVKCGIRKMWWRELQPYDTPKAKIKHLKQMLEDAGMKGRYSMEKARQIRDERELKADLEQIQQGAKDWGKTSGDEDEAEGSDGGAPRRRAARGRQALAFLESDGEETD